MEKLGRAEAWAFAVGMGLLCCMSLGAACTSDKGPTVGQSGSEGIPDPGGNTVPCPCQLPNAAAFRVSVLSQQGAWVSLRIDEVLNGNLPLSAGDVIEASRYDETFACYRGCAALEVGDQALALYRPGEPALPPCAERDACTAMCDPASAAEDERWGSACVCRASAALQANPSDSPTCGVEVVEGFQDCVQACERDTAEACSPRPAQNYRRGTVRLSPWSDPIVFARSDRGEVSVPVSELDQLWRSASSDPSADLAACRDRYGDWSDLLPNAP